MCIDNQSYVLLVCESLINEFDPLRQVTTRAPPLNVIAPSPQQSPKQTEETFKEFNPFAPVRPSLSETNISRLKLEHNTVSTTPLHSVHSQSNLTTHKISSNRIYQVNDGHISPSTSKSPGFPRERPQGKSLETSGSMELMDNPFTDYAIPTDEKSRSKFWIGPLSEVEMVKVKQDEGGAKRREISSNIYRPLSLESLEDNRSDSSNRIHLDYKARRMRSISTLHSKDNLTQSDNHLIEPSSVPVELHSKGQGASAQVSHAKSRSPKFFRRKVIVIINYVFMAMFKGKRY